MTTATINQDASKGNHQGEPRGVSPRRTANPDATASNVRDEKGRFTRGNKGGPGNPFARQMAALRQALVDSVTAEDIRAIAQKLLEKAREGNEPAAKLLFQYVLGKPGPAPNPDRLDLEEWQIFLEHEPVAYGINKACLSADPSLYLTLARGMKPEVTQIMGKELVEAFQDPAGWSKKHEGERWELVAERKKKGNAEEAKNAEETPRETGINGGRGGGCLPLTPGPSPRRGEGSKSPRETEVAVKDAYPSPRALCPGGRGDAEGNGG